MPAVPRAASAWPYKEVDAGGLCAAPTSTPDVTDRSFGWLKKLRKTDEFSSVFRFRCGRRGQVLDVSAGSNDLGFARLGLIVPKKVISTAVGRNRVKRLLREWFRQQQQDLGSVDIIARLKGKSDGGTLDETVLRKDFLSGLADSRACVKRRQPVPNNTD